MPSVYALKPAFQNLLRPLVRRMAAWGVTPNQVTVISCVLSVLLGWELTFGSRPWILLPVFLPFRMALNAIDGMLAREHNQQTRLGAMLNELTDVVSDAALTLPLAYVDGVKPLGVGVAIFFAALTEMAGVLDRVGRRYDGPFGKSDRALVLGVLGAWLALGWPIAAGWLLWLPGLWILLCVVTIANRMRGVEAR